MTWTTGVGMALVLGAVAAACVVYIGGLVGPSVPADVIDFVQRHGVPPTDDAHRLIDRYIRRTRSFRTTWCATGVVAAAVIGMAWYSRIAAGTTPNAPLADVGFMGLGAWFLGVVHAEAYNNRPRLRGPRVASLEPRRATRYRVRRAVITVRLVTVLAALVCAASVVVSVARRPYGATLTLLAVAVVVTAELSQWGIGRRARPVTRPDLVAADEAIRRAAAEVVDLGAAGFLLVICGWQVVQFGLSYSPPPAALSAAPGFGVIALIFVIAAGAMARLARRVTHPTSRQRLAMARAHPVAVADP